LLSDRTLEESTTMLEFEKPSMFANPLSLPPDATTVDAAMICNECPKMVLLVMNT
jgi:hypothetical protein